MPTCSRSLFTSTPGPERRSYQLNFASLDFFKPVDAAQKRGLAAAGGSDEAHDLMLVDRHIDAPKHGNRTEFVRHCGFQ